MCDLATAYEMGDVLPKDEQKAAQLYQLAVDGGSKTALTMLGNCYRAGIGVEQNKEKAVELYKMAVESGNMDEVNPWSEYIMGLCFSSGTGVEKDESKALEWFYKAARNGEGNTDAMFEIGLYNFQGIVTEKNYKQAFDWFSIASEKGDPDSNLFLGYMYRDGLYVESNFDTAFEFFSKAADAGLPSAIKEIGFLYFNGQGVERDVQTAINWFRKGAELGDSIAQRMTAFSYTDFCSPEECDLQKAISWFEQSAKQGDVISLNNLGDIYSHRWTLFKDYVPIDMKQAFDYYLKAAEFGYPPAQYSVGRLYEYQDVPGFMPNYEKAMFWYEKAASNEYIPAYEAISSMYHHGIGIEKSEEKAIEWRCKAIENGYFYSCYYYLGYYNDTVPKEIIDSLLVASQKGYKEAKNNLAQLYLSGKAHCEDRKIAIDIFTEAAEEGDLRSQYQLALLYLQKHYPLHKYYVNYDVNKARNLLEALVVSYEQKPYLDNGALPECATGAYYNLGILYKRGIGVEKNEDKALDFFTKAATNGTHLALVEIEKIQRSRHENISEFYRTLSNKDLLDYALSCFKEACEEMSRRYKDGDGQEQNDERALYWLKKSQGKIAPKSLRQKLSSIFGKKSILHLQKFREPQKWVWQK